MMRTMNSAEISGVVKSNMDSLIQANKNKPVCIHMQPKNMISEGNKISYESTLRKDNSKPPVVTKTLTVQGQDLKITYDSYRCDLCKEEILIPRVSSNEDFFSDMAQLANVFKDYTDIDPYIRANISEESVGVSGLVGDTFVDQLYRDKKGSARRFNILSLKTYITYVGELGVTLYKTIKNGGAVTGASNVNYDVKPAAQVYKKNNTGFQRPIGQVTRIAKNNLEQFTPTFGE